MLLSRGKCSERVIRMFLVVAFYMLKILLCTFFHKQWPTQKINETLCTVHVVCSPASNSASNEYQIVLKTGKGTPKAYNECSQTICIFWGFALFSWFYSLLKLLTTLTSLHSNRHVTIQTMGQQGSPETIFQLWLGIQSWNKLHQITHRMSYQLTSWLCKAAAQPSLFIWRKQFGWVIHKASQWFYYNLVSVNHQFSTALL